MATCELYLQARNQARRRVVKRRKWRSNCAKRAKEPPSEPPEVEEFAGFASARAADPTSLSEPLQLQADFDWIADTGATSHLTPHRHWLQDYKPCRIPVRLADHSVIYAAGIGTVAFDPILHGKQAPPVAFSRVLHVPELRSNLLSCLYLTRVKGLTMVAQGSQIRFLDGKQLLFAATVHSSNSATLDGVTVPTQEHARLAATLPVDLSLLHRRFCHHNYADIKKLLNCDMAVGLKDLLQSKDKPDPICESCLAGKMHSATTSQ